ncbi:hypothetical protein M0638_06650 [Roseomonas sp. NAR14]|uniref:Lipoprotein n=1 Tax=Roseomonas acroporae TaxID=2937791 RepID=A0A9X1Y6I3_9PROT|nr:hypothetical protein [Roseomonas acroporae]MCK8784057.1 hypothetical protein [Roseomonas acroporae]
MATKAGAALPLLGALALLGGCGDASLLPARCPRIAILADAADLTQFRPGGGQDLTAMQVDGRMVGVSGQCDYAGRGREALNVTLSVAIEAERGPAAEGRTADLPYFIAVTGRDERRILDKQPTVTTVRFGANTTRTTVRTDSMTIRLPLGDRHQAEDYTVLVGFQLTPEQLALNRRRGPR